jgi:O-antigen/teichoic acid export membrane protein
MRRPPERLAQSSIARNAAYGAAGQAATTVLAILLTAALGRWLGAADFGTYYVLITMSTSVYLLLEWGQSLWVLRESARVPARAGEFLGTALVFRLAIVAAAAMPLGLGTRALGYDSRTTWLFVLLFVATTPLFLAQAYGVAFRAAERMGRDAAVAVANKIMVLAVAVPALALGAGIPAIILATAVAGGLALVMARSLYSSMNAPPLSASKDTARAMLLGGLPVLSMSASGAAQPYLEALILSKFATVTAIGYYGAARNIVGTLLAPAVILGAASYPRIARAAHHPPSLSRELQDALRPLVWLGALGALGTFLFAETVVGLIYGSAFLPAATILKFYAPLLFLIFINILLGNALYASGAWTGWAIVLGVKVLVSAVASIVLVPIVQARSGNGGIAIVLSWAVCELGVVAGACLLLPRGTLTSAAILDVGRALAAAASTLLLFWVLPDLTPWLGVPLCIAAFSAASWLLGLLHLHDVEALRGIFRRPRNGVVPALNAPS